jgi:hypothetical protein
VVEYRCCYEDCPYDMTEAVSEAFVRRDTGVFGMLARIPIIGRFFVVTSVVVTCPNDHACEYPRIPTVVEV